MKNRWIPLPFWFAWLVWSWLLIFPGMSAATLYASLIYNLGPIVTFIIGLIGAGLGGFVSAVVSRRLHGER